MCQAVLRRGAGPIIAQRQTKFVTLKPLCMETLKDGGELLKRARLTASIEVGSWTYYFCGSGLPRELETTADVKSYSGCLSSDWCTSMSHFRRRTRRQTSYSRLSRSQYPKCFESHTTIEVSRSNDHCIPRGYNKVRFRRVTSSMPPASIQRADSSL